MGYTIGNENVVHISLLICHQGRAIFISVTSINAKQERWKLKHFSSSDMKFPNVYIRYKGTGMWADCIIKRCGMGTYRKRAGMCETSKKRNSVFITSSHWLQWWYTLLRYPHIQYALLPDELTLFLLHFCNALFVYTRKTKGEKCRKCRKRRDLHFKHAAKSTIALVEELKARWTQVDPSQSGKPHFVKTHHHK